MIDTFTRTCIIGWGTGGRVSEGSDTFSFTLFTVTSEAPNFYVFTPFLGRAFTDPKILSFDDDSDSESDRGRDGRPRLTDGPDGPRRLHTISRSREGVKGQRNRRLRQAFTRLRFYEILLPRQSFIYASMAKSPNFYATPTL